MFYTEIQPSSNVATWIQSLWYFSAPDDLTGTYRHRVLPDGCVSLVWTPLGESLDAIMVSGPQLHAFEVPVRAGDTFCGVRLQPWATRALFYSAGGVPLPDLRGLRAPLKKIAPSFADSLRSQLLLPADAKETLGAVETVIGDWSRRAAPADGAVAAAATLLATGTARIGDVAAAVALSERQLQRRFRHAVGLTPKQYARIRRFRTALANVLRTEPETWSRVAQDCGFADQAHMTREFVAFFGAPPESLRAHVDPIEHRDVTP